MNKIIIETCEGLNYLHINGLIHRDIKPNNIIISEDGTYKICDFEMIKELKDPDKSTRVGTNGYMAPEVRDQKDYDESADIYSLGISILQMISKDAAENLEKSWYQEIILYDLKTTNPLIFEICSKCLKKDPKERISAQEIITKIENSENEGKFHILPKKFNITKNLTSKNFKYEIFLINNTESKIFHIKVKFNKRNLLL